MPAEIITLQQLFEVVRQPNRIELYYAASKLLNTTWMHISVSVSLGVKKVQSLDDLLDNVDNLTCPHFLLGECFPHGNVFGAIHLNENQLVLNEPVVLNFYKVWMMERCQCFDARYCFAAFIAVQRADIDASNHKLLVLIVAHDENFTVTLFVVQALQNVWVVVWVTEAVIGALTHACVNRETWTGTVSLVLTWVKWPRAHGLRLLSMNLVHFMLLNALRNCVLSHPVLLVRKAGTFLRERICNRLLVLNIVLLLHRNEALTDMLMSWLNDSMDRDDHFLHVHSLSHEQRVVLLLGNSVVNWFLLTLLG